MTPIIKILGGEIKEFSGGKYILVKGGNTHWFFQPLQVALHIGDTYNNNSNWGSGVLPSSEKQGSHINKKVIFFITI